MITGVSPMSVHYACQWPELPVPFAPTLMVAVLQWRKLLASEGVLGKLVRQVGVAPCSTGWQSVLLVDRSMETQQQLTQPANRKRCFLQHQAGGPAALARRLLDQLSGRDLPPMQKPVISPPIAEPAPATQPGSAPAESSEQVHPK